jgi:pyruvate,water dikinase
MTSSLELSDPLHGTSEPDRFWTTTNVAEATPDILSPLCWDIWSDGLERAWLRSMFDFGLLARSETVLQPDPNQRSTASILGRQVANVAVIRKVMGRLPNVDPDDVERDLLGSVREDLPKETGTRLRLPVIAARLPWVMLRTNALVQAMHLRNRDWWRTEVLATDVEVDPLTRLQRASAMFAEAMNLHSRMRYLVPAAAAAVRALVTRSAVAAPALDGGFGNVAETALSDDLWRVSRGELSLEDFISEHGFHGPNEGNVYTRSWREQPERVAALVASYRSRTDIMRPRDREQAAIQAREDAERRVLAASSLPLRPAVRFVARRLANLTRNLELTKASYLRALDGARAAARALGANLVAEAIIDEPDDAFFLTIEEHRRLAHGGLPNVKQLVAYRRAQRVRYASIQLPVSFTGMPEPVSSTAGGCSPPGEAIAGVAGGCGVAEGCARVVFDPNSDIELDEGDILVCRSTDPSWAPLFVTAAALVIDIGSAASHGAVVAREMNIPYVIGTGNSTTAIREGDRIRVDGNNSAVHILARTETAGEPAEELGLGHGLNP